MILDKKQMFVDTASRIFSFLVNLYGYSGPCIKYYQKNYFIVVYFYKTNLAVECIFDYREEDITCKISKLEHGELTEELSINSSGKIVKERLSVLLRKKGMRDKLFTNVSGMPIEKRIEVTLQDFARMLKVYGKDVLNDDPAFLL